MYEVEPTFSEMIQQHIRSRPSRYEIISEYIINNICMAAGYGLTYYNFDLLNSDRLLVRMLKSSGFSKKDLTRNVIATIITNMTVEFFPRKTNYGVDDMFIIFYNDDDSEIFNRFDLTEKQTLSAVKKFDSFCFVWA
jgi:hypothetical protein